MLNEGASPQRARSVLPNSLKTEVVMTANLREWRHFFRLRTAPAAHPQTREVTIYLANYLAGKKREVYPAPFAVRPFERAGVREYWIVDPDDKTVQVFVLEDGHYTAKDYGAAGDTVRVNVLKDCAIDLSQVFPE